MEIPKAESRAIEKGVCFLGWDLIRRRLGSWKGKERAGIMGETPMARKEEGRKRGGMKNRGAGRRKLW